MFGILKTLSGLNAVESIIDNVVRDKVAHPAIGSVVYCDLAFGHAEHSGIYIGGNEIIHLNSKGWIEYVTPEEFTSGTTAISIYTSCRDGRAVGDPSVAENARTFEKKVSVKNYNVFLDNCHMFSSACLTGNSENSESFLWMLKETAKREISANDWRVWDTSEKFGALARSKRTGNLYFSWGARTAESAKRSALSDADEEADVVCWTGGSKWIAVAEGARRVGWDYDASKSRACNKALKACGDSDAKIRLCFSTLDGYEFQHA